MVNENEKAEFNAAIAYLNRINSLFALCTEASIELDMHQWYHALKCIFRELSDEMKPESIKKYKDDFENVRIKLESSGEEIRRGVYDGLEDIEINLRALYKETGMKMKYAIEGKFKIT